MIMTKSAVKHWHGKELPYDVAYLEKNHSHEKWKTVTYTEILKRKTERQLWKLELKRRSDHWTPCFIWVFKVDFFLFGGWYLYIKTQKKDYAINFKGAHPDIAEKVMELYPCGVFPDFGNLELWCKCFASQFPHSGFKRDKNQGLLPAYALIDKNGELTDIKQK